MAKQTFTTGQVLTAAQMTDLQQTAMLGGAASAKTASYVLVAADAGTAITMNSASATTITVNTALFAAGDTVQITNIGAGVCTITAGTATVNTSASLALAQYESGTLTFTSTSASIFIKGATASATAGGMTLLSTTSLTGATTTISSISQSYKSLFFITSGVSNATADGFLRVAPNASSSSGNQTILTSTIATVQSAGGDYLLLTDNQTVANYQARATTTNTFATTIDNYASSTTYKPYITYGYYQRTGPGACASTISGAFASNTAITSLVFSNSGGNLSTGTVLLYGVN
jgi:hypothetical protein